MSELDGRTIILGVAGGIAAYKAADLVSKLAQAGATVRCVLTHNAAQFVAPATFQALSGQPAYTETFAAPERFGMGHLSLAADADALIVAPATADILAKAAHGIADDLLSTTLLSVTCPVLFAPAMNCAMWEKPATQRNVAQLRADGATIVGPGSGWLACRQTGAGRMAEVPEIVWAIRRAVFQPKDLTGRTVLVTAGPTREAFDPVRFISNPSTGKQGFAVAEAALLRGARVILVSGPTSVKPPEGAEVIAVTSADEMLAAVMAHVDEADVVIGVAAVADHAPTIAADRKAPKAEQDLTVTLRTTPDVIANAAARRRLGQIFVGFAAETHDVVEHAAVKLARKGLDLLVANDLTAERAGFGGDTNVVTLLSADAAPEPWEPMSKLAVGQRLLERVAARLRPAEGTSEG